MLSTIKKYQEKLLGLGCLPVAVDRILGLAGKHLDIFQSERPQWYALQLVVGNFFARPETDFFEKPKVGKYYNFEQSKLTDYTKSLTIAELGLEFEFQVSPDFYHITDPELYLPYIAYQITGRPAMSIDDGEEDVPINIEDPKRQMLAWFRRSCPWIDPCVFSYLSSDDLIYGVLWFSEDWQEIEPRLQCLMKEHPYFKIYLEFYRTRCSGLWQRQVLREGLTGLAGVRRMYEIRNRDFLAECPRESYGDMTVVKIPHD